MDATELARWTRFAAKGGIGKCQAIVDCVAESAEDLMFLQNDEVTVLMQIPDQPNLYLGYCEGVVGRFKGSDVHFLTRLKKPIMTKRSSVTASTSSSLRTRSPSPAPGLKTPSPMPTARRVVTQPTSRTSLDAGLLSPKPFDHPEPSGASSAQQQLLQIQNGKQDSSFHSSDETRATPLPSPSIASAPSVSPNHTSTSHETLATPLNSRASVSSLASTVDSSYTPHAANTPLPHVHQDEDVPESPPHPQTQPQPQLRHPLPPELHQDPNDSTTTITKTTTPPDTSLTSDTFPHSRISIALSDGEVGIGLSLLQDLVNGGEYSDWSDSEDEDGDGDHGRQQGAGRRRKGRTQSGGTSDSSRYSTYTADRLGYEDTETGHGSLAHSHGDEDDDGEEGEGSRTGQDITVHHAPASHTNTTVPLVSPKEMTFPPVAPLSPSRARLRPSPIGTTRPEQYAFPTPPTHVHPNPNAQPWSPLPDHPEFEHERERRPSLAPSAASTSTSTGTGATSDWEGAADIYDDYRYSRFSMAPASPSASVFSSSSYVRGPPGRRVSAASSLGRVSVASSARMGSGGAGGGNGVSEGYPEFVDNPEARSRADSVYSYSRPSGEVSVPPPASAFQKTATTTLANKEDGDAAATVPSVVLAPGEKEEERLDEESSRKRHPRTESPLGDGSESESEESVYTQSSNERASMSVPPTIFDTPPTSNSNSIPSPNLLPPPVSPANLSLPASSSSSSSASSTQNSRNVSPAGRPGPLVLDDSAADKLLHTTWDSPVGPATGTNAGYTGTGEGFAGGQGHTTTPASATYFPTAAGGLEALLSGEPTAGSAQASALRQRIEAGRAPAGGEGVRGEGARIVVEDEDDPSLLRPAGHGHGKFGVPLRESPEPEPELVAQGKQVSLVVANPSRTPSPSEENVAKREVDEGATRSHGAPLAPLSVTNLEVGPQSPSAPLSPVVPHLRPSLSELRGGRPGQPEGERRSLFLPHPNAPKAPDSHSPGPMYIAQRQPPPAQPPHQIRGGVIPVIKMALGARAPTIYGRTKEELSAANGPVLMLFSLEPPPATAPPPMMGSPLRVAQPIPILAPSPVRASFGSILGPESRQASPAFKGGVGEDRPVSADKGAGGVIPRANFFPKAGGVRPRSRSFSGFNSTTAEVPLPIQKSREEGNRPSLALSATDVRQSLTSLNTTPTAPPATQGGKPVPKPSPLRTASPLSLPQNNNIGTRHAKPPTSPLAAGFGQSAPTSPTGSFTSSRLVHPLRQATSGSALDEPPSPRPVPVSRATLPANGPRQPGRETPNDGEPTSRPSVETDAASVRSARSQITSPPPTVARHNSLRTKLSLPNLRRNLTRHDDGLNSPGANHGSDTETMQVQDMDFELVRPNIAQLQAARSSEDSGVLGQDHSVDANHGAGRTESPAVAAGAPKSPTVATNTPPPVVVSPAWQPVTVPAQPAIFESESSMDAHRQREQKWMSVMGSVPPAQSRKNKKVKKLLFDGVPSSVRPLVWSHLTDGKARCVPGIYAQLGGRGRVPAFSNIERDVQLCFSDHPQLQSMQVQALSLLQSYLTMVPDIQYTTGLTLIVGQLLLFTLEEDAFWIFVSIMDTHLRPYFSSSTTQIEVDSALFSRALESIDAVASRKLLTDMGISPSAICRPWFTSLFVGSLPTDHLNRVWDIFLFEGIPFLIRVGLALIFCCRKQILDATSEELVLKHLQHPPPTSLPPSVDAFISLALSFKLKDGDIRKQRIKMEAQVKRQTHTPRLVSTPGTISLPKA